MDLFQEAFQQYDDDLQMYNADLNRDDSFQVFYYANNQEINLGAFDENSIVFIMKGKLDVNRGFREKSQFEMNDMFFVSKALGPYAGITLESTILINLRSDNLLPFRDIVLLNKIVSSIAPVPVELEKLRVKKTLRYFLSGIIYYRLNNIFSEYVYDMKKKEFVFLLRTLYDKETIARFFSPILLSQSPFRMHVIDNYRHDSTVKQLADKCFMTTKTFTRKFKLEFGMTPYRWIVLQKVKALEAYLSLNATSLDEILKEFYFEDEAEFNNFCDKHNVKGKLLES